MSDEGTNVFIEFQIALKSDINLLFQELDLLIAAGKMIYFWSKEIDPEVMKEYALKTKIPVTQKERDEHKECIRLKIAEGLSFKEIADKLGISTKKVGYYTRVDPKKDWVLDDWIVGYYKKDSSVYPKVDIAVDNDQRLVDRFKRAGREANYVEKL